MSDLVIRSGSVVSGDGVVVADVAITDGAISAVGPNLDSAVEEIDATGLHVFPGGIDSHVHFNEPGHTDWETIANGSAALAAGGYTTFVDMPLNSLPVTIDGESFDAKLRAMQASSVLDFGLWGGLVPTNLDELNALHARGVMGFKAFMCPSGLDEFPACDAPGLQEGMKRIAELDSILLVHAEDPAWLSDPKGPTVNDFLESRPVMAEVSALFEAIHFARGAGCRLHIVHVSEHRVAAIVQGGKDSGLDVSGETCPHYLLYGQEDLQRLGGIGKCAPPLRPQGSSGDLWTALTEGLLKMVVSDHSPSTLDLKRGDDFRKIWGGISGCQSTRQLLLARGMDPTLLAAVTSTNIAERFRLARKGHVAPGFDADLWLADLSWEGTVRSEDLLYLNPFSPHEGQPIRGRTVMTILHGQAVYRDGRVLTGHRGRHLTPSSSAR